METPILTAHTGSAIHPHIPHLADLRISVFREYPYLYDGTAEYEAQYLAGFAESPGAVLVTACCRGKIVGASTALPMSHADEEFRQPFTEAGWEVSTVFYFGESVLLPEYRGHGIGHAFFDLREAHAATQANVTHFAFCAVERPAGHPLRPAGYRPLDAFWTKRGYGKRPDIVARFPWKDIDQPEETEKPLVFWVRELR